MLMAFTPNAYSIHLECLWYSPQMLIAEELFAISKNTSEFSIKTHWEI